MSAAIAAEIHIRQLQPSDLPSVMAITSVAYCKEYHESQVRARFVQRSLYRTL